MARAVTRYVEALCTVTGVATPCSNASMYVCNRDGGEDEDESVHLELQEAAAKDWADTCRDH